MLKPKIKLELDSAEVFDRLSILEVKKTYSQDPLVKQSLNEQCLDLMNLINLELGYDNARRVYLSQEYANLYNVNRAIFEAIDKLKKEDIAPKVVDNLNYNRYTAKKELQEKFFGQLDEIKIGY